MIRQGDPHGCGCLIGLALCAISALVVIALGWLIGLTLAGWFS